LGCRTSIAFGVTGVLWATGPIIMSIREMSGGKSASPGTISITGKDGKFNAEKAKAEMPEGITITDANGKTKTID